MMNKNYLHKYIVVSYYLGYNEKTETEKFIWYQMTVSKNFIWQSKG